MDFVPQPEEAKKFGSIKWIKWNIYRYPQIFILMIPFPYYFYSFGQLYINYKRKTNNGTYVPEVIFNRYAICRPGDFTDINTPSRYKN